MDDHSLLGVIIGIQTAALLLFGYFMYHGFQTMLKTQMLIAKLVVQETEKVSHIVAH